MKSPENEKIVTRSKCTKKDIRLYDDTRNGVIYTV